MTFHEQLTSYMDALGITGVQLGKVCNIAQSTISRYKNGERLPGSNVVQVLAAGLSKLAIEKGIDGFEKDIIAEELGERIWAPSPQVDFNVLKRNLDILLSELNINIKEMATSMHYDVSQIYRIRNGSRKPSNPIYFIENTVRYVLNTYKSYTDRLKIARLTGTVLIPIEAPVNSKTESFQSFCRWLAQDPSNLNCNAGRFFQAVDAYRLDQYLRNDNTSLTSIKSERVTKEKRYSGENGIDNAILDFFNTVTYGISRKNIYIYSDFPINNSEEDNPGYINALLQMIENAIRKGMHITNIHHIDHAFNDMIIDVEFWLPLLLSGQISVFFLEGSEDIQEIFRHILMTSCDTVMFGSGIAQFENDTSFTLTRNKKIIEDCQSRMSQLMKHTKPLFKVYNKSNEIALEEFLEKDVSVPGDRISYLPVPPIHTISNKLLASILARNHVSDEDAKRIRKYVKHKRARVNAILKHSRITELVAKLEEPEFTKQPPSLFLAEAFIPQEIYYTYDEYLEHLHDTRAFAQKTRRYELLEHTALLYRNVRINVHRKNWVVISCSDRPAIHFMGEQEKFVDKIENMTMFKKISG